MTISDDLKSDYRALSDESGYAIFEWTVVALTGEDRARFLNGLCTNDVVRLQVGQGCEAFGTTVQGKTAGYYYVFCEANCLRIHTAAGQTDTIIRGFEKYIIREDVRLEDRSEQSASLLISGQKSQEILAKLCGSLGLASMDHTACQMGSIALTIARVPFGGDTSFLATCDRKDFEELQQTLASHGIRKCSSEALELLRIESGSPVYGVDISDDNLPQEIGRDAVAIHFEKGCYLGQETIARLDAMGHVNRLLVGLRFDSTTVPSPGEIIENDGKPIARLTSTCWSPRLHSPLALGFVRRSHFTTGNSFESPYGLVTVVDLPVSLQSES